MDVTMIMPPTPKVAAPELDPIEHGPSFDEVMARDDAEPRERSTRADRDDRAGAQAAAGRAEARTAAEKAAAAKAGAKTPGEAAAKPGAGMQVEAQLVDPGALKGEEMPESLTRASVADRLVHALMARGGEGTGEPAGEGELTGNLLTNALSMTDETAIDLKALGKPSAPTEAPPQAPIRPVNLQAATPAGTRNGEAVTSRLPAGVDESSVMRQITDGLKLGRLGRKQTAEIQLHPAELGKVTVKIQMEAGMARVFVGAEHAAVADMLGATMEQLRNDLMAQGVHVEHFEVSHHGPGADGGGEGGDGEGDELAEDGDASTETATRHRLHDGRISVTA